MVRVRVTRVQARGVAVELSQPAKLWLTGQEALETGAHITFDARASPAGTSDGTAAVLKQSGPISVLAPPGAFDAVINSLRAGLRDSMRWSSGDQAGLVPSLVVGDTSTLETHIVDEFRTTGLSHLTAVSGTNLTLMLAFVLLLAKWAGARGWWLRGIAVVCVAGFVVLCRGEPSVLRAAAMGVVALGATGVSGDKAKGIRQLSVAVCALLLIDPWMSHSWGFGLSVAATAGIIWWAKRWASALSSWCPQWAAEALSVPLAAQLVTQPLVTALNGQISLVGLFANLLAGPFVGPVTVSGLVAALIHPMSAVGARCIGWVAGWCAEPILLIARLGAMLPNSAVQVGATALVLALMSVACLVAARVMPLILAKPTATLTALAVLAAGSFIRVPQPGWPGDWLVTFCDVGQGDAAVLRSPAGDVVLIDGGPDKAALHACLDAVDVSGISLVVASHQHADHIDGLSGLASRHDIGAIVVRSGLSESARSAFATFIGDGSIPVLLAAVGEVLQVGDITITIIWTGLPFVLSRPPATVEDPDENNAGIVALVEVAGLRVLFAGDSEPEAQNAALATGAPLQADVLKVAHHGSVNQSAEFINAVNATVAVISVGTDNSYGHPSSRTLNALTSAGAFTLRTDERGSIALTIGAQGSLVVTAQRSPP
jgi:competence protein ComEC